MTDAKKVAEMLEQYHSLHRRAAYIFGNAAKLMGQGRGTFASLPEPAELAQAVATVLMLMRRSESYDAAGKDTKCPSAIFGEELAKFDDKVWPWAPAPTTPDGARELYHRLLEESSYSDEYYDEHDGPSR